MSSAIVRIYEIIFMKNYIS